MANYGNDRLVVTSRTETPHSSFLSKGCDFGVGIKFGTGLFHSTHQMTPERQISRGLRPERQMCRPVHAWAVW